MKKRWLSFSLSGHLGVVALICLKIPAKKVEKIVNIKTISQKEFNEKFQIVSSDKTSKKGKHGDKVYLSDVDNAEKKNTRAEKSGKFNQESITSIVKQGKYSSEVKGKGVSASDDFIEGAAIGPMTLLNTQAFKYTNYYERIKNAVSENWRPLIRISIKLMKANPKKYGTLEIGVYTTKLEIILNEKGEIIDTRVVGKSGVESFDEVSIKSFKKSGPFASPPKELVKNGRFTIRWNFIIDVQPSGVVEFKGGQVQ